MKEHSYEVHIDWTGNQGDGTKSYKSYKRDFTVICAGKPPVPGSSDPAFRGDRSRYNPEELLVASVSSCHMLWYLHLCAVNGIAVLAYEDHATGKMEEIADGSGAFTSVRLSPRVTISAGDDTQKAEALHHEAHRLCYIARSVSFPVECVPSTVVSAVPAGR